MDNDLFLTCETLQLSRSLVRGENVDGTFVLKCSQTQGYLVVDAAQVKVLEQFEQPRTVPEVLELCINDRICLPLRELYELVLKAYRAGILCGEQPVRMRRPAIRWFAGIRPVIAAPVVVVLALITIAVLVLRAPLPPASLPEIALGWVVACGALSLGRIFAATVLRGAGGEIYHPQLRWQTGLPHFAVDLRDACMLGRGTCALVHAAPLVTVGATGAVALWFGHGWSMVVLAVWMIQCRPAVGGSMPRLFELLRRKPLRDTSTCPLFTTERGWREAARSRWEWFDVRSAAIQFVYGVVWALALGHFAYRYLRLDPRLAFASSQTWREAGLAVGGVALGAALLVIVGAILVAIGKAGRRAWSRAVLSWRRWRSRSDREDGVSVEALLRRNVLLRTLPPATLAELAQHAQPFSVGAWRALVHFEEEPPAVGLIVSGRVSVYRRINSGRKVRFLQLVEDDLFGAHALVDPENQSLEVRTQTPCRGLIIPSEDFKRLVVDRLGPAVVCSYAHKLPFLRQTSLCAQWRAPAIVRFIELARIVAYPAGAKIILQGGEVRWLCVIYEGRARVLQGCKQIGKLHAGEVFGEMSLLQASGATADVEAIDPTRCFIVDRLEFIRFMSRNHHVALQVERIGSRRLGRPIFPLSGQSFDVR